MALSNISKDHVNNLLQLVNMNDLDNNKVIQSIQRNSNNYGKLKILFKQMQFIKNEINEIVQDSIVSTELDNVKCSFKKIPGKTYYLYKEDKEDNKDGMYFSMLSPDEWNKYTTFISAYLYDYDLTFNKV